LVKALQEVPRARREGLVFLLEDMPAADLNALCAAFLLEHLNLAYEAWEQAPWRAQVTRDLCFNDVLPYACLSETRESWRAQLREVCAPIVASCKAPGEAAHLLNQKIFPLLKVRYNTGHRRQSAARRALASDLRHQFPARGRVLSDDLAARQRVGACGQCHRPLHAKVADGCGEQWAAFGPSCRTQRPACGG
jgi:hypothetical protein